MLDVNKYIIHGEWLERDPEGHLSALPHWSPKVAAEAAEREGMTLEEVHWRVLAWLRERFRQEGPAWRAREVTRDLDAEFAAEGGLRYLYRLFPRGPLAQGCRLAGLPLPAGAIDPAFGSVH